MPAHRDQVVENWRRIVRSLVLGVLFMLCLPRATLAAGSDAEEVFANLVNAANDCLRDDMIQLPSDAYLIDYWECLSATKLISQIRTWYGDSYPEELPPDLVAAASLTQVAEELTRAQL